MYRLCSGQSGNFVADCCYLWFVFKWVDGWNEIVFGGLRHTCRRKSSAGKPGQLWSTTKTHLCWDLSKDPSCNMCVRHGHSTISVIEIYFQALEYELNWGNICFSTFIITLSLFLIMPWIRLEPNNPKWSIRPYFRPSNNFCCACGSNLCFCDQ